MYKTYKITDAAGVSKYRAVVRGANEGEVAKPGAAGDGKCVGFTDEAQALQNKPVKVAVAGFAFATASGAIAYGDAVEIADNTGKIRSCQARLAAATAGAAEVVNVVGYAEKAAGADGDVIPIRIAVFSKGTPVS